MKQSTAIQKGFNSDVLFEGKRYHIQTQDWGLTRAEVTTQVFNSGAIIKTIRVPYTKVLPAGDTQPDVIKIAVETQHQSVIELLLSGHLIPS